MNKIGLSVVVVAGMLSGCASNPLPAPGTAPGDMSPEAHRETAKAHEEKAEEQEELSEHAQKGPQQAAHKEKADEEEDVAKQHERAAEGAAKAK